MYCQLWYTLLMMALLHCAISDAWLTWTPEGLQAVVWRMLEAYCSNECSGRVIQH